MATEAEKRMLPGAVTGRARGRVPMASLKAKQSKNASRGK